jgi:hypothetical protein
MRPLRTLLLFACSPENTTFSYQQAWPRHFVAHPAFACTTINVADRRWHSRLRSNGVARVWRGDLVVILHSVFSNSCLLDGPLSEAVSALKPPKAYFIGNEYKLMPEKMAFCDAIGVSLLVSQSSLPAVHELYRNRLGCEVIGIPNTGLDTALFQPRVPWSDRRIDLGYRAADVPWYLGHNERRELADFFTAKARHYGLTVDISLDPADRFAESEWAGFLNDCRAQLGSEAGGDYFSLDDGLRLRVNDYIHDHPGVTIQATHRQFFSDAPTGVPMRIMSGRHIEAAGTKTVQVLLEGRYDGYLEPDIHYIPLSKDFSNADDAVRKLRDPAFCGRLAENAYQVAVDALTYPKLISRFVEGVSRLL